MYCNFDRIKKYIMYFVMYFFIVSVVILFIFAIDKKEMLTISANICLADYIDGFAGYSYSHIIIIPFSFLFINCLSDLYCSNINYYIRMKSRTKIIILKIVKNIIFSVILSLLIVLASVVVGGLMSRSLMNWNSKISYNFLATNILINADFYIILLIMFLEFLLSFCFYSILMCMLKQRINNVLSFIITLVISGTNIIYKVVYFLCDSTSSLFTWEYINNAQKILFFGIYPIGSLLFIALSIKLTKRKDLWT